ncbi:hypothetical protein FRC12_024299 [Ceratobasidium sp. 428]|nr:hypothetical protein FRC12_024299 [Ceratobasidium sp. 428]
MSLVRTFTHLAGQPHAPEALHLLKRICDLVSPVMRRHGWLLPVLAEFFPDDSRLLGLNVNAGAKILIRLRPAQSPTTFYPIEQLVSVMLHELTHNVHGPHDEKFYSFLNKLEDEYHALVTGGWRGTGFFAPGDKLGSRNTGLRGTEGAFSRFDTTGKRKAIEAAEARRRVEALGSGGRLGGPRVASQSGKTRQELAAEAAERRRLDEQLCAASHPSADREAARAAADSIAEVVADADLAEALALSNALAESTADIRATPSSSAGPSGSRVQVAETHKTEDEVIEIDSDSDEERDNILSRSPAARELQCPKCTYMNPPTTLEHHCVMCGAQLVAPFGGSLDEAWNCSVCTLENEPRAQRCEACDFPKNRRDWAPVRRRQTSQEVRPRSESERSTPGTWTCELCTFVNVRASRVCSMCEAPCPLTVPQSSGSLQSGRSSSAEIVRLGKLNTSSPPSWNCRQCGEQGINHEFWMCGTCGWIKDTSSIPRN